MTRIETFTDAAFAFAVTLLVISIDAVPTTYAELLGVLRGVPAFALSMALLMAFWHGHWRWSRRFGLDDGPTVLLSCALVLVVLSYVYPLKFLVSLWTHWVSGGAATAGATIDSYEELYGAFAVYGVGFAAMSLVLVALNAYAHHRADDLGLDARERFLTRSEVGAWLLMAGVGGLSVLLALTTPHHPIGPPGWAYMLLPVVMPLYGRMMDRRWRRIERAAMAGEAVAVPSAQGAIQ